VFMFNFFETNLNFQNTINIYLQQKTDQTLLAHSLSDQYGSKICPLGNVIGWLYGVFLFLRKIFIPEAWIRSLVSTLFLISFFFGGLIMNLNAAVYLVPIAIMEFYRLYQNLL
jgi:hypothetical protein